MQPETITKHKWFWISEDEKEEVWLRAMANQGFHLKSFGGLSRYTFEVCAPKDIIYRLDFNTDRKKYWNYVRLFQDGGWELINKNGRNNWKYFRKEAIIGEAPEIFTENESKAKKYQQVFFILVAVSIILFPQTVNFSRFGENGLFWDIIILLRLVPYLLVFYMVVRPGVRIKQLQKRL